VTRLEAFVGGDQRRPQLLGLGLEDEFGIALHDDPVPSRDLVLELSRRPARIAQIGAHLVRGNVLTDEPREDVRPRARVQVPEDPIGARRCLARAPGDVDRVQRDWAAEVDAARGEPCSSEVRKDLPEWVARRPIDDETQCTRVAVVAEEQHDRTREDRTADLPCGDQHPARGQRAGGEPRRHGSDRQNGRGGD